MKTVDEALWLQTKRAYEKVDPERGPEITTFARKLAEGVEEHIENVEGELTSTQLRALVEGVTRDLNPIHLRGLELVEAYVVLSQVWELRERFIESFTFIEHMFVTENLAQKQILSQQEAEKEGQNSSSSSI